MNLVAVLKKHCHNCKRLDCIYWNVGIQDFVKCQRPWPRMQPNRKRRSKWRKIYNELVKIGLQHLHLLIMNCLLISFFFSGESLLQQYQSPIVIQPISYSSHSVATDCQQVRMRSPQDFLDTQSRIQRSLEAISTARLQSEEAWLEAEKAYNEAQDAEKLGTALDQVTAWILGPSYRVIVIDVFFYVHTYISGPGEMLLNVSQRVGGDASSAEALLRKHEALELRCRLAYARYAELMRKVDVLPVAAKSREDLLTRRDLMDSACRYNNPELNCI